MKNIILLISLQTLIGCDYRNPEKPFIINQKIINYCNRENECLYKYVSKNKLTATFMETNNKYNMGDTIK